MVVPPTTGLDLIAEIESHRLIDAKGCKSDLINQPFNGINSGDAQRLIQVRDALIPYAEAESSNTCCEENAEKGWTAIEAARALQDEINGKNGGGVEYP